MADNGAENTSKITTSERDSSLSTFAIIGLGTRETLVNHFNNCFEGGKFHHGVRDLTSPERIQSLVETCKSFLCSDGVDSVQSTGSEWRDGCLHANLDGFEWAESEISNEFSRSGGSQVDGCLVLGSVFRTDNVTIELLEILISSIFESSLGRVSKEGWGPSCVDTTETFGTSNLPPGLEVTGVQLGIDLTTAFD